MVSFARSPAPGPTGHPTGPNRGVEAEPTGALPGEHAVGVGFVEQAVAAEVAEHASLENVLEFGPVLGSE
jgi:hypothetical protein